MTSRSLSVCNGQTWSHIRLLKVLTYNFLLLKEKPKGYNTLLALLSISLVHTSFVCKWGQDGRKKKPSWSQDEQPLLSLCFITHSYEFGEARLLLFKYVVTAFNHILALHMYRNSFQNYFLYHISMDWGKVDLLLVLKTFFWSFCKIRGTFAFFQSSGISPKCHDLHYFSCNCGIQL